MLLNSQNYEGISLLNAYCIHFDYAIFTLIGDYLKASDMQFAYKGKNSATICSVFYLDTLHHYTNCTSNDINYLLDTSKAFDRKH